MTARERISILKSQIENLLCPLIDSDFVLLDLPYHSNLGDTLIWQGEIDFFRKIEYDYLFGTYLYGNMDRVEKHIKKNTIVLFHGGGNFGDIWPEHSKFRRKAISRFVHQRCIVLPQTIHYDNPKALEADVKFYSKHPNVTICARDIKSYKILQAHFSNNPSLLVPDMAFCMDMSCYARNSAPCGSIFVKREDKELKFDIDISAVPKESIVSDWTYLADSTVYSFNNVVSRILRKIDFRSHSDLNNYFNDWYWNNIIRPFNVKTAIDFIDKYHSVYTTRMHAAILGILLEKSDIKLFDNTYGKSSSFFRTWLQGIDGVQLI